MSARIRPEGALAAVLVSALLAAPAARAQTCTTDNVYVSFNTYLGGPAADEVRDLQLIPSLDGPVGSLGNDILITGQTASSTLPRGNTALNGGNNVFVSRLSPDGNRVRWSFLFGTDGDDSGARVAAGPSGEVYVVGRLAGAPLPSSYGFRVYSAAGGQTDAFLARLTAEGKPDWILYLSSAQDEEALGLALAKDTVYVVGKTRATLDDQFPKAIPPTANTRYGAPGSDGSNFDAFIVKVSLGASPTLAWSRVLAASHTSNPKADDIAQALLVLGSDVYVGGKVEGAILNPENISVDSHCNIPVAGVVMKLDTDGGARWISCLGGREGGTEVQALLSQPGGNLIAVGDTIAPDFLSPGAGLDSGRDVFAQKMAPNGTLLEGLRVAVPGTQQARGRAALHPASGRVLLGGSTDSALFDGATLPGRGFDDTFSAPGGEGFVLSLAADLTRLEWGSYVGGTDGKTPESVAAVVVDEKTGVLVLAGTSSATDLMRVRTGVELKAPEFQNGFVFGLMPDSTPPQSRQDKPLEVRLDEQGRLDVSWKDVFTDPESGISSYEWSVFRADSPTPEFTRAVTADQAQAELVPNRRYTVQVQATNGAGCTTALSRPIGEDSSAPGAPQSPLGWTCGVTDPGAASLMGVGLVALLRLARRARPRSRDS